MWKIFNKWGESIAIPIEIPGFGTAYKEVGPSKVIYIKPDELNSSIERLAKKGRIELTKISDKEYEYIILKEQKLIDLRISRHRKQKLKLEGEIKKPSKSLVNGLKEIKKDNKKKNKKED